MYYRIYKRRGAVRSREPVDANNRWVGRISVDSVPPPHTAASIMRCICKAEELDQSRPSQLWVHPSDDKPLGEGHVSILADPRPGSTPEDPMAFVESPPSTPPPGVPWAPECIPSQDDRIDLSLSRRFSNSTASTSSHRPSLQQVRVMTVSGQSLLKTGGSGHPHLLSSVQHPKSQLVEGRNG